MPRLSKIPTLARAYVSDVIPIPREEQIALCAEAVEAIGGLPPLDKVYGPKEADALLRDIRPTEVAVLIRVLALNEKPSPGNIGVGAALASRIVALEERSLYVLDVVAKLRSTDKAWADHRHAAIRSAQRGQSLKKSEARKRQRQSVKVRGSIVEHWESLEGTPIYNRVRRHWQDREIPNAEEAIATAPEEAGKLRDASRKTWDRIFGGRSQVKKKAVKRRGKK